MLRKFKVTVNNEIYEIQVEEIVEDGTLLTSTAPIEKTPITLPQSAPAPAPPQANTSVKQTSGTGHPVVAPLPGIILNILVNAGEKVTAGQTVLVLEAMKMENEIAAPVTGTVTSLLVSKGQNVNTNETLLTIE